MKHTLYILLLFISLGLNAQIGNSNQGISNTIGSGRMGFRYVQSQYEPEAKAFFDALSLTNDTVKEAINTFVQQMKDSLPVEWADMVAIYPFVGNGTRTGSAETHKYNLLDPQDADSSFRLTFVNSVTHDGLGIRIVYTPGATGYVNTHIRPSSKLTFNNTHLAVYSTKDTILAARYDMGSYEGVNYFAINISNSDKALSFHYNNVADQGKLQITNTNSKIFWVSSRTSASYHSIYIDGIKKGSNTTTGGALPSINMFLGGRNNNGTADSQTMRSYGYASIGGGFSDASNVIYYRVVERLMFALRRSNEVIYANREGISPLITPQENYALLDSFIINYSIVEIGDMPSEIYEISQPLVVPSNRTITLNSTLKMMTSDSTILTTDVSKDDLSINVSNGSVFNIGQWIGITDTATGRNTIYNTRYAWVGEITGIVGNTITMDYKAPDNYWKDSMSLVATCQPIFFLDEVSNVIVKGQGMIDGNKNNQAQLSATQLDRNGLKLIENCGGGTGINMYAVSHVLIDGLRIKDCLKHGISLNKSRPSEIYDTCRNVSLTNLYIKNSHDKNICVYESDSISISNVICDSATWEDGLMFYDNVANVWVNNYSATYNYRYGMSWQQTNNNFTATNITTINNQQSGIRVNAPLATITNAVMSDRLEISGRDYTLTDVVLNNISISGAVANSKSRQTFWIYGSGLTDVTINGLYLNGNSTTLSPGAGITCQDYYGIPVNVTINGGYITNHTGTIQDLGSCDITFTNFTGLE